jgi:hypothetical protein
MNEADKRELYLGLIDLTCGTYALGDLSTEEQEKAILLLRCRLANYKTDEEARIQFGPLQPANILSQISKVPTEVVNAIADNLDITLPDDIVIEEGEENDAEIVFNPDGDEFEPEAEEDDFFKAPYANNAIEYVENMLAMMKKGEVRSISVAAVNDNGLASLWVPEFVDEEDIQELFSPIIDVLQSDDDPKKMN